MLGYFELCRHHIGLMLSHLGLFWGLAHVAPSWAILGFVLNSRPGKAFAQKHRKYQEKTQFLGCVADGFGCVFWAALRLCLPDHRLMLLCWYHVGLMLSNFCVFCGLCWPLLGKRWDHTGLILGHVGTFFATLAPHWAHVEPCWSIFVHFAVYVGVCLGLGHLSVVEFSSMQVVCKKHCKY